MSVIYLDFINDVLRRVGEIAGDAEALATSTVTSTATGLTATEAFTNSRIQHKIDVALSLTNEVFDQLLAMGMYAKSAATATVILVSGQREYDLPTDFERMMGMEERFRVLRGATNGMILPEYPGGYAAMLAEQTYATQYTGQPLSWALSPADDKIRLDAEPTSAEAGYTYNYLYEKSVSLTSTMATEVLPVKDKVARALVPVVSEAYQRWFKKELDADFFEEALNRALGYASRKPPKDSWGRG